jgi:hypothetical protein
MTPTTTNRFLLVVAATSLLTLSACSGGARSGGTVGPAGGTITSASGLRLTVPAGALQSQVELHIVEVEPGAGAMARVQLEPHDLVLAAPAHLSFKVEDGNVRAAEVEHGAEGEVKHQLETRRHTAQGEVEVQVETLGEVELEHGATCDPACDTGMECDDGVCKAEDVGDDSGTDPTATGTTPDDHGTDPATPATPTAPATPDDSGHHA